MKQFKDQNAKLYGYILIKMNRDIKVCVAEDCDALSNQLEKQICEGTKSIVPIDLYSLITSFSDISHEDVKLIQYTGDFLKNSPTRSFSLVAAKDINVNVNTFAGLFTASNEQYIYRYLHGDANRDIRGDIILLMCEHEENAPTNKYKCGFIGIEECYELYHYLHMILRLYNEKAKELAPFGAFTPVYIPDYSHLIK